MDSQKLFIFFVAAKFKSLRRTLVRRNDLNFTRLEYEGFSESISILTFLRVYQV